MRQTLYSTIQVTTSHSNILLFILSITNYHTIQVIFTSALTSYISLKIWFFFQQLYFNLHLQKKALCLDFQKFEINIIYTNKT